MLPTHVMPSQMLMAVEGQAGGHCSALCRRQRRNLALSCDGSAVLLPASACPRET